MEISLEMLLTLLTTLLGGGGIGTIITLRWASAKAKAEAKVTEAEAETASTAAAKEMQDMYQQLIADVKADRDEQKAYINELKEDRQHLREERDELRNRMEQTDQRVRELQEQVARNGRMVEGMRPFMCGVLDCPKRMSVNISADGSAITGRRNTSKKQGTI